MARLLCRHGSMLGTTPRDSASLLYQRYIRRQQPEKHRDSLEQYLIFQAHNFLAIHGVAILFCSQMAWLLCSRDPHWYREFTSRYLFRRLLLVRVFALVPDDSTIVF